MPVYMLTSEMPYDELQCWLEYFERRPVGWRSDLRAAYLLGAQGVKAKPSTIFPSLGAVMAERSADPVSSLKGSYMHAKMLSAKGGTKLGD